MAETTRIQWAHATFNCWRGCQKVSPGCTNCYAESESRRNPKVLGEWGPGGKRVIAAESYWRKPIAWDRAAAKAGERRRVFCASLADVFEARPELVAPRERLLELISRTPHLDWLLLTKRPENIRPSLLEIVRRFSHDLRRLAAFVLAVDWVTGKPPANVWLGVSVEDQARADERIPVLLGIPARVRFLSVEPLLGRVDLRSWIAPPCSECGHNPMQFRRPDGTCAIVGTDTPWGNRCHRDGVNWVIVGGESGPRARPCELAWVRSIVGQCDAAGVPCFVKQLGAVPTVNSFALADGWALHVRAHDEPGVPGRLVLQLRDRKGGDIEEWPAHLRVREFPTP